MGQEQDIAQSPVDVTSDADYMDTGVLHAHRVCVNCGNDDACQGFKLCSDCLEDPDTPDVLKELVH